MKEITINSVAHKMLESEIKSCITLRYRVVRSATAQNTYYRSTNKTYLVMISINVRLMK